MKTKFKIAFFLGLGLYLYILTNFSYVSVYYTYVALPTLAILGLFGFGNAIEAIGMGAHNFLITNLIEGGIIGLILMTVFWGYLVLKTKYKIGIVMFPFLIAGLSFASLAIPYLYVIFAIILVLESRKNQIAK